MIHLAPFVLTDFGPTAHVGPSCAPKHHKTVPQTLPCTTLHHPALDRSKFSLRLLFPLPPAIPFLASGWIVPRVCARKISELLGGRHERWVTKEGQSFEATEPRCWTGQNTKAPKLALLSQRTKSLAGPESNESGLGHSGAWPKERHIAWWFARGVADARQTRVKTKAGRKGAHLRDNGLSKHTTLFWYVGEHEGHWQKSVLVKISAWSRSFKTSQQRH